MNKVILMGRLVKDPELRYTQGAVPMAELTQALTKWNRKCDFGQVIASGLNVKALEEHIFEELADVKLVLDQVIHMMGCEDKVQRIMKQKINRTFERISENNACN